MLRLLNKVASDKYEVLDTEDGVIERYSSGAIINAVVGLGLTI